MRMRDLSSLAHELRNLNPSEAADLNRIVERMQAETEYAGKGESLDYKTLSTDRDAKPMQPASEEITLNNIEAAMTYQPWDSKQQDAGDLVRETLTIAARAILRYVPRSPRRTLAIQHLISARMDANAAISFKGRF